VSMILDTHSPTLGQREALNSRLLALRASLARSTPEAIGSEVARMFLRFPATAKDQGNSKAIIAVYVDELSSFPLWAVKQGIARATLGATFAPSAPVIRVECYNAVNLSRLEGVRISKILNAEVYHEPSPEEKARVLAGFAEVSRQVQETADLKKSKRAPNKVSQEEALARLEILRDQPLPKLSTAVRGPL